MGAEISLSAVPDLAWAVGQGVLVMVAMMMGSAIGEEIAGFFFGKTKGGITQIIYLMMYMPLFIIGGYVYTLSGIPMTSAVTSGLFFGIWGVITVFVSRFLITIINKIFGIKFTGPKRVHINGKDLIKNMKEKGLPDNDIRNVLVYSCESPKKARQVFEGGPEWINVEPEELCYALAKKSYNVHDVMKVLTVILKLKPEDAAGIWKKASV